MKNLLITILFISSFSTSAQKEGQIFCEGDETETYFPSIDSKKYIVWGNTFYVEKLVGKKKLNNKTYKEFTQTWESGHVAYLYLREHDGIIFQFEECCSDDTIRIPKQPKNGLTWKSADGLSSYEIITLKGKLKTPICTYKNLLVLKSIFENGTFTFYYQKGYGYIGAVQNKELISFVTPISPKELLEE
ncbi:hypothetical protein [Algibacter sp. 2305UL17-15]|uniref:hypothetical protein n=1 Tax=Algibacter sp. 2305UL17-15 TaxID=3231268 RepID=UPI00345B257B